MSVAVITDSSACIPAEMVDRFGIRVVPIIIQLPTGAIRADADPAAEEVYAALSREDPVKSSAPSVAEYLSILDQAAGEAETALVLTPATEFTVMHRNASLAADLAGLPVTVVDSRTAAAAQGLVVLEAARAAAAGAPISDVARAAEDASRRADLVAALDRLDHIKRSGRVPAAAVGLAEHLGVRPVFRLHQGTVQRLGVPRSDVAAIRRIRREALGRGFATDLPSAVFHGTDGARAESLRQLLGGSSFVTRFSPSMGIHTGPGVVGVAWLSAGSR
jgi:DegV family protein with EDD domain